jgi:predicted nucleotidyltransferase
MATARELSPEQMADYRAAAQRRDRAERRALAAREQRAWTLAHRVSALLRELFHVDRMMVFGSLAHPGCFTAWSDVDIAVWGLRPEETFRAIGVAMDVDVVIPVNLVDVMTCSPALVQVVEREGIPV